jgi:serine protease Do
VMAVGNPFGLGGTVTAGIVSARGRDIHEGPYDDFLQIDAAINQGNSGGPTFSTDGSVIGINTAIFSPSGGSVGIGFAIPSNLAKPIIAELKEQGHIDRGWLGVSIQPLDRDLAAYLGQPELSGVIVNSVADDSPAKQAGLAAGDILVAFGEHPVEAEKEEDLGSFQRLVAGTTPGTKVKLELLRGGKRKTVTTELATQPTVEPAEAESDLGFQVQEITENLYRDERLPTRAGAYVSFVTGGTPAAEAGLTPGDVVVRIGDSEVSSLDQFRRASAAAAGAERVLVHARRGGDLRFLLLKRGAPSSVATEPASEASDTRD